METSLLARLLGATRTVSPVAPVKATSLALPQLRAGESVRAEVTARLTDGTFRVMVDGKALRLALPAGSKPGDILELRVTEQDPKLKFEASNAPNPGKAAVSSVGRFIGALLSEPAGPSPRQADPILQLPPAEPSELPEPLARAVERSGLFYESHQARWVHGDYPLDRLREEPQAVLTKSTGTGAKAEMPATVGPGGTPVEVKTMVVIDFDHETRSHTAPQFTGADDTSATRDTPHADLAARETLPLVRQQLDTLDTRQVSWLGEIWPGQSMRWEIAEEREGNIERGEVPQWSTRLGLSLPQLGELGAVLSIGSRGVRIALTAQEPIAFTSMKASLQELASALEAAGVAVVGLEVHRGDAPV
jgi:hypothetical protein